MVTTPSKVAKSCSILEFSHIQVMHITLQKILPPPNKIGFFLYILMLNEQSQFLKWSYLDTIRTLAKVQKNNETMGRSTQTVTRCSLVGMGSEQPEGNPRYSPS
jgi:hypothetical protein